jgi:hypothetical protein
VLYGICAYAFKIPCITYKIPYNTPWDRPFIYKPSSSLNIAQTFNF